MLSNNGDGRESTLKYCDLTPIWINNWDQGDSISCNFTIGDECTAVLTTQSSTKVLSSFL